MSWVLRLMLSVFALGLGWTSAATAQVPRAIGNPGFEANDPAGPGAPGFEIFANGVVPGWESTSGFIEIWDSNFSGVPAFEGQRFAEINANDPGALFQNICLIRGETFRWSFAHRARSGGPATQTVRFGVASSTGTVLQTFATQASTVASSQWNVNSNQTGVTYTGATGIQRVQFSTTDVGSFGNFLDAIRISINPFVELSAATGSGSESIASAQLPTIVVTGDVTTAFSVSVSVTGGTATRGSDFTTPNGAATFTVPVPVGTYNQTAIPLGIVISDDSIVEANETIQLGLNAVPASYSLLSTSSCGAAGRATSTYTITDNDARITLRKQWASATTGDSATLTLSRGATVLDTFASDAASPSDLDTDATPTAVVIGDTVQLAETLGGGNASNYFATLGCTGAADTNLADGLTIAGGETAITCTYTNTRSGITVTKMSSVISDGVDAINPKAIPGATVRYCILVTNTGATLATSVAIADTLPADVSYSSPSLASGTACPGTTTSEDDDATGGDEADPFGASISGNIVTGVAASLAAGESFAISFDVKIR